MKIQVQSTTDYDQFHLLTGNRKVNKDHVNWLVREIKKSNLLPVQPMIVTEEKGIFDGQHRLEAARKAALPIYYAVVPGLNPQNIARLNNSQRPWSLEDYIFFFSENKNVEYQKLLRFMHDHPIFTTTGAVSITYFGKSGTVGVAQVKKGEFAMGEEKNIEVLTQLLYRVHNSVANPDIVRSTSFINTLHPLFIRDLTEGTQTTQEIVEKLENYGKPIPLYDRQHDYLRFFEDLLNGGIGKRGSFRLF